MVRKFMDVPLDCEYLLVRYRHREVLLPEHGAVAVDAVCVNVADVA